MIAPLEKERSTPSRGAARRQTQSQATPSNGVPLGAVFAEGRFHFTLLDACGRIAALAKALLLSAIAHHARMGNVALVLGGLRFRELYRRRRDNFQIRDSSVW